MAQAREHPRSLWENLLSHFSERHDDEYAAVEATTNEDLSGRTGGPVAAPRVERFPRKGDDEDISE